MRILAKLNARKLTFTEEQQELLVAANEEETRSESMRSLWVSKAQIRLHAHTKQ